MKLRKLLLAAAGAAVAVSTLVASEAPVAADEQFFPMLVYRTGPYAPNGIPIANAYRDYLDLVNKRDGGINGVTATWEECETKYNTKIGVECYEKLKANASVFNPYSTGITYKLLENAPVDKVPIFSMGYGRTAAADGTVFEWGFNFPTTYWSQASAFVQYVGDQEGGLDKLKGKKIALVYHNSAYGKEPIPTLEVLAKKHGYELQLLAVDHPGQEQKASWLQIRRSKPDYVFMWGWGVMNSVAIKEAAAINFPMDKFIGVWWSGSENDVQPAGDDAIGYKAGTFHGVGANWQVHQDILKHIYGGDEAKARENNWGEVLYNRGMLNAMYVVEAVRVAQEKFGKGKTMTGEEVRWGLENLNITAERLKELGMEDFTRPLQVTCKDHETGGPVLIQQWDGKKWNIISDWVPTMQDVVRPLVEEAAMAYAKEKGIEPRSCS